MSALPDPDIVDAVAATLQRAERVLFITGAGISADSGLPTYRGIGGLYHDRLTDDNLPIEEALSGAMLNRAPQITWKYLKQIEETCRGARYNDAHRIIALLEDHCNVCVLTQNVDGLHRAAGSRNLIEIHGDLHDLYCRACGYRVTVSDYVALDIPPPCPQCRKGLLRPDVVLFGEYLPEDKLERLYAELAQGFDMVFSIGTTSVFPYIAEPVRAAWRADVPTVEINPGTTAVTPYVEYKLAAGAAVSLSRIWAQYLSS